MSCGKLLFATAFAMWKNVLNSMKMNDWIIWNNEKENKACKKWKIMYNGFGLTISKYM